MNRFADDDLHTLWRQDVSIFDHVAQQSRRMGFTYCCFGVRLPLPVAEPKFHIDFNYPHAWRERFVSQNYLTVDPTVAHAMVSDAIIVWSPQVFANATDMWEDANAHGVKVGWAKPCRQANGAIGMLSLSRDAEDLSAGEVALRSAEMARMADMLLVSVTGEHMARHIPEAAAILTEREKEVLRWTADGKTSYEIGRILSISVGTVNFHLNKAIAKLNTVNKTQAVVKAVILRLL